MEADCRFPTGALRLCGDGTVCPEASEASGVGFKVSGYGIWDFKFGIEVQPQGVRFTGCSLYTHPSIGNIWPPEYSRLEATGGIC